MRAGRKVLYCSMKESGTYLETGVNISSTLCINPTNQRISPISSSPLIVELRHLGPEPCLQFINQALILELLHLGLQLCLQFINQALIVELLHLGLERRLKFSNQVLIEELLHLSPKPSSFQ